jgi:hypothetical protein
MVQKVSRVFGDILDDAPKEPALQNKEMGPPQIAPLERVLVQAHAEQNVSCGLAAVRHLHDPDKTSMALGRREPVAYARHSASILSTSLRVPARTVPASAARYRFVAGLGTPTFR